MQHSVVGLDADRLLALVQTALDITASARRRLALSQPDPHKARVREGTSSLLKDRIAPAAVLNFRQLPFDR